MNLTMIIEKSGISLLLFAICVYYAFRVLVMKDYRAILGNQEKAPKDVEGYCKATGLLIVFFGIATLVMAGLVLFSPVVGLIQMIICTAVLGVMWKKVTDKYI